MYINKRRSPTLVDVCDFHRLNLRETNASLNAKNYFLSKSPLLPMSFRDLRLVVTNRIPSNVLFLPKTSSQTTLNIPRSSFRPHKITQKKPTKSSGYDVYRTLSRSTVSEHDPSNDDANLLANSFTVDRISPLSHTGFFRTNHLPKICKPQYQSSQNLNFNREQSEFFGTIRQTSTEIECEQTNQDRTRKQIHVFIPTINS